MPAGTIEALRALVDNAIDIGLASRPLKENEVGLPIDEHPFATVPLAVVVHKRHPLTEIRTAQLIRLYDGTARRWPDGKRVVLLIR